MSNILRKKDNGRTDVLVHVADNLRRMRHAAGLSQGALAQTADVSRRMIVNIEKGDVNVSLNTLDRLAEALGTSLQAFIAAPDTRDASRIDERIWAGRDPASEGRLLASTAAHQEVELSMWSLAPGEDYTSDADPTGWHNMIVVLAGQLTLTYGHNVRVLPAGEFCVFESDVGHRFTNAHHQVLEFVRNVVH